jgi:ketopantoate reductase
MQDGPIRFDNRGSARTPSSVAILNDGGDHLMDVGRAIWDRRVVGGVWGAGLGRVMGGVSTAGTGDIACHNV